MDFSRLRASTIPGLLVERARARPARVAFRAKELGVYRETTWAALAARVRRWRRGWPRGSASAAAARWRSSATRARSGRSRTSRRRRSAPSPTGSYPTSAPGEVRYLLEHARRRVVIVEDQEHLDKTLAVLDDAPGVRA